MLQIEEREDMLRFVHEAMATELVVALAGVDAQYARQSAQEIFARVDDVESKLSLYREGSDVSRINLCKEGAEVRVSEDCALCLAEASQASVLTKNRFHAFLGVQSLRRKGKVPNYLSNMVGKDNSYQNDTPSIQLDLESRVVRKVKEGQVLDLGGVGKGYALDCVIEILDDWEIPAAMLSFGGSTLLFHAVDGEAEWKGSLGGRELRPFWKGALSSSGLGFQGEHIVDPSSVEGRESLWVRSYSRCARAGLADALSTAAMLMTEPELQMLQEDNPELALAVEGAEGTVFAESFCSWKGIG